jgi:hypothetical protein
MLSDNEHAEITTSSLTVVATTKTSNMACLVQKTVTFSSKCVIIQLSEEMNTWRREPNPDMSVSARRSLQTFLEELTEDGKQGSSLIEERMQIVYSTLEIKLQMKREEDAKYARGKSEGDEEESSDKPSDKSTEESSDKSTDESSDKSTDESSDEEDDDYDDDYDDDNIVFA